MNSPRQLVVSADDFGFTHDVNEGIVEAHRKGIVTTTSLMGNGMAFEQAVRLARETPGLDIGCHLVLVGGRSLLPPFRAYPSTVAELVLSAELRRIRIREELEAQVRRILDSGITPSHLNTHKHTAVLPQVLEALARISEDFHIPWVRRPFSILLLRGHFRRILELHGCRTTDHFAGFRMTGRFHTRELADFIRRLPEGTTEFMCHPGRCTGELRSAPTKLKESRERELEALTAPETAEAVREAGIRLVNFREM